MLLNTSSQSYVERKNHHKPRLIAGIQWFWRFSQFYGEYAVRSPQERQQWVDQQRKVTNKASLYSS